jgi:hypothetical protein
MSGDTIVTTVEALKLFIQSLPAGCMFDIISFGSSYQSMSQTGMKYDDQTMKSSIEQI